MLENQVDTVTEDVQSIITKARNLLLETATATEESAEEVRKEAIEMLATALDKFDKTRKQAARAGKKWAKTTEKTLKENSWTSVATAIGVGMLFGALLARRSEGPSK